MEGGQPLGLVGPLTPVCNELDVLLTNRLRWGADGVGGAICAWCGGTMGLSWDRTALSPMLDGGGGYCCNLREGTGFFFLSLVCPVSIVLEMKPRSGAAFEVGYYFLFWSERRQNRSVDSLRNCFGVVPFSGGFAREHIQPYHWLSSSCAMGHAKAAFDCTLGFLSVLHRVGACAETPAEE